MLRMEFYPNGCAATKKDPELVAMSLTAYKKHTDLKRFKYLLNIP